jgi:hypothetical protein
MKNYPRYVSFEKAYYFYNNLMYSYQKIIEEKKRKEKKLNLFSEGRHKYDANSSFQSKYG